MRKSIALFLLAIAVTRGYSQEISNLRKSLDSLTSLKKSYQNKIIEIDQEYKRIEDLMIEKNFEQSIGEIYKCVKDAKIYSPHNSLIAQLSVGDKVRVIGQDENTYTVIYNSQRGWVMKDALRTEGAIATRKADLTKKYGSASAQKILEGMVWIGMTDAMAVESIGKPKEINRSVGSWGVHEQWVYGNDIFLYFENGKLTSWQD